MTDSEFLIHLENNGKIKYYLFGSEGLWKIEGTCLSLSENQRLKEECYGYSGESEWYIATTRYTVVAKTSKWGQPLEKFWNSIDFEWAEAEGLRLDEWFSGTPDW